MRDLFARLLPYTLLLFPFVFTTGHMMRRILLYKYAQNGLSFNQWDVFFFFFEYHRFVALFYIPFFLCLAIKKVSECLTPYELLRYGSYTRWVFKNSVSFTSVPLFLLGNILLAAVSLSFGIPRSWNWSELATTPIHDRIKGTMYTLSQSYSTPLLAFLFSVLSYLLTTLAMYWTVSLLYVWLQQKNKVFLICGFWWLAVVVMHDDTFEQLPHMCNLVNYFSRYNDCAISTSLVHIGIWFGVLLVIYALLDASIAVKWRRRQKKNSSVERSITS